MVEVRLFAGLRQGRDKVIMMVPDSVVCVRDIMCRSEIPSAEMNIPLRSGFHQKPERAVKDGDVVALFPAVGGG